MSVAVNLSVRQVLDPGILELVAQTLARTGIPPESLHLELTESLFIQQSTSFARTLAGLKDLGVRLSLDDFGTGYASLSYLSRFPFDAVKIDHAFIDGLGVEPQDAALVSAILSMADALGLSVTAEGIEQPVQLARLKELGCRRAQGFYFDRPMPADLMRERVADPSRWLAAIDAARNF
jgi:EAL domain-containing protein (putative c-di-GMP-specific phosphodiesterase class I)